MISVIITAYREERTIQRAIKQVLNQLTKKDELIITAPDEETRKEVKKIKDRRIKFIQDKGNGKPSALNEALPKAKGEILVLTDGDVYIDEKAIEEIIKPFRYKNIGAATGRPITINKRNNMLGYWSHLLTDAGAHKKRIAQRKKDKFIAGSGYLLAIKKELIKSIPENILSDDAYISHSIANQGYKIVYVPNARVYVKYPSTWKDWINQKVRSTGGYKQLKKVIQTKENMRSFTKESIKIHWALGYPKTIKEFIWTLVLIVARIYLWILIIWRTKIRKEEFNKIWVRIESTK